MTYEVVVVGGGIGGLTTAALLAARGLSVCLFERQSNLGGCVANLEHLGYTFEPTLGLYSGWGADGIYQRIFSELPVEPPEVRRLSTAYTVRLPDQTELALSDHQAQFENDLRLGFPESPQAAVDFYRKLEEISRLETKPEFGEGPAAAHLSECSERFRRFIDIQLQTFTHCASDQCSLKLAAQALTTPRQGLWAIRGGAQTLANALGKSLQQSGGTLRLNSPVLRLAYGSDGAPIGVDLLSGERVIATRAIISNLTVWDSYGKLIGLGRTPPAVSSQLRQSSSWGAYLVFLSLEAAAATRLKSDRVLALTDWQSNQSYEPDQAQFFFAAAPDWDSRAPEGQRAVTVSAFTRADEWFTFHADETAHEEQDQATLESLWTRLHSAMPELGDSVEVIETATPRTFYENTRRKFGMVGRPCASREIQNVGRTHFPNVFLVGDTISLDPGLAGVAKSALALADSLVGPLT
jgi:phytoene dehydrogenase-like protein